MLESRIPQNLEMFICAPQNAHLTLANGEPPKTGFRPLRGTEHSLGIETGLSFP